VLRSEGRIILVYKMKQYKYFKNVVCASVECVWNYNYMLGKKRHVVIECVGQCPSPFAFDFCKLTSHNTKYPFQICTILLLGQNESHLSSVINLIYITLIVINRGYIFKIDVTYLVPVNLAQLI
jgi:hypothetical protein